MKADMKTVKKTKGRKLRGYQQWLQPKKVLGKMKETQSKEIAQFPSASEGSQVLLEELAKKLDASVETPNTAGASRALIDLWESYTDGEDFEKEVLAMLHVHRN
ncbi:hypothetical protein HKX48_002130 [Thoreauomyces humboldtii]|nr:hypothetical protein HKX48_002130 [Thoreauomyces humboldtii]